MSPSCTDGLSMPIEGEVRPEARNRNSFSASLA